MVALHTNLAFMEEWQEKSDTSKRRGRWSNIQGNPERKLVRRLKLRPGFTVEQAVPQ